MRYGLIISPVSKENSAIRNRADFVENLVKNALKDFKDFLKIDI